MIRHNWTITQRTINNNTVKEITRTHRINTNKGSAKTAHIGPARINTFMNKYNMYRTHKYHTYIAYRDCLGSTRTNNQEQRMQNQHRSMDLSEQEHTGNQTHKNKQE